MYLALGRAGDRHRAHAADARQGVGHGVVEDFVQARHTLGSAHRQHDDRNHVGGELEDDGVLGIVGKHGRHHVELVAHIVGEHVDVFAVFKFEGNDRYVLARLGCDVLEVVDGVEHIFERACHILLDILGACTGVGGHHHDGVGLHVGIKVDRQLFKREQTQDDHRHEAEGGHDRSLDRTSV